MSDNTGFSLTLHEITISLPVSFTEEKCNLLREAFVDGFGISPILTEDPEIDYYIDKIMEGRRGPNPETIMVRVPYSDLSDDEKGVYVRDAETVRNQRAIHRILADMV